MTSIIDQVRNRNNLEVRWPSRLLLEALGLQTKVRRRVVDYLEQQGIEALSVRELMDVFLPPPSAPLLDFSDWWRRIPILDQPQFGPILHDSALLTLTEADLGPAYRAEWAARLARLKVYELGEGRVHKRRQRTERKRGGG
jgi:hypothetical protein